MTVQDLIITLASRSETSLTVKVSGIDVTDGHSYRLMLAYRSDAERTIVDMNLTPSVKTVTKTVTGLDPRTSYEFKVKLTDTYGSMERTTVKSVYFETMPVVISLKATGSTASTISTALTGLPTFSYDVKVRYSYTPDGGRETFAGYVEIERGDTGKIQRLFTGLRQKTTYTITAYIYRTDKDEFIGKKQISASTLAYVPGTAPRPYITGSGTIPRIGVGYVEISVENPDPDHYSIHLFSSDAESGHYDFYADVGSDLVAKIVDRADDTMFYKVAAVDGNDMPHNMSEAFEVYFPDLEGPSKTEGNLCYITTGEIRELADTMRDIYNYQVKVHDDATLEPYYAKVMRHLPEIEENAPIKGGDSSILDSIGEMASAVREYEDFDVGESGDPVQAEMINVLTYYVYNALLAIKNAETEDDNEGD